MCHLFRCVAVTRLPVHSLNYLYSISFSCPLFLARVPPHLCPALPFGDFSHFCHRQQCVGGVQRAQNFASFELNKLDTRMKEKAKAVSVCCVQLYVRIMNFGWVLQRRITGSERTRSHWKSNKHSIARYTASTALAMRTISNFQLLN